MEPTDPQETIEHLERALRTPRRIGAAIGIVMAAMKITYDDAFAVLVNASQRTNRKLREVADDVLYTGTVVAMVGSAAPGSERGNGLAAVDGPVARCPRR